KNIRIHWYAYNRGNQYGIPMFLTKQGGNPLFRNPVMNCRANPYANQNIHPDLAKDFHHLFPGKCTPLFRGHTKVIIFSLDRLMMSHKFSHILFHFEKADE